MKRSQLKSKCLRLSLSRNNSRCQLRSKSQCQSNKCERIIQVPEIVEKLVEKLVEVPKIVEVEKIVEKIVPVPRIVERIVEVEKIKEKIVERCILKTQIKEVVRIVEKPCFVEELVIVEVPIPKYIQRDIPKEVVVEVLAKDREIIREKDIHYIEQPPNLIVQKQQVPVELITDKMVIVELPINKYIDLKHQVITPVEKQVPRILEVPRIVPVQQTVVKIEPIDRIVERIVPVKEQLCPQVVQVCTKVEKLIVEKQVQFIEVEKPRTVQVPVEVSQIVEKIIPVVQTIQKIKEVQLLSERIVDRIIKVPEVIAIDRFEQVPIIQKQYIPVEKTVKQIAEMNKIVTKIEDRLIEIPFLYENLKEIQKKELMIVETKEVQSHMVKKQLTVEKAVIQESLKKVCEKVHQISNAMHVVEVACEKQLPPMVIHKEKIMEVPVVLEKIAERIIVMPQIVEVLKYVHEITEQENLGIPVSGDVAIEEAEYQKLARNVNTEVNNLKKMFNSLKTSQLREQSVVIEKFLSEFNKFIVYPRIRQIVNEKFIDKIVEKDRIVQVPVSTANNERRNLTSAVLIDKLLNQIRRMKLNNPNLRHQFDPEIANTFGESLNPISSSYGSDYNKLLDDYAKVIHSKFGSSGLNLNQQSLLQEYVEDRFDLAYNAKKNQSAAKSWRSKYQSLLEKTKQYKSLINSLADIFKDVYPLFPSVLDKGVRDRNFDTHKKKQYEEELQKIYRILHGFSASETTQKIHQLDYQRINRVVREKTDEIEILKKRIQELMLNGKYDRGDNQRGIILQKENKNLRSQINNLRVYIRELKENNDSDRIIYDLKIKIQQLQQQNQNCNDLIYKLEEQIRILKIQLENCTCKGAYGRNHEEYTGLNQGSSDDQYASRHHRGYETGQGQVSYKQSQYMSESRGSDGSGKIGVQSLKNQNYKSSAQKSEYRENVSSYQTIQHSSRSNIHSKIQSQSSNMYGTSSREIIKRNYEDDSNQRYK